MKRLQPHYGPAFAKILVALRKSQGLTQQELVERSKVPLHIVRQYELGSRDPGVIDVVQIALALGVDPVALLNEILRQEKG